MTATRTTQTAVATEGLIPPNATPDQIRLILTGLAAENGVELKALVVEDDEPSKVVEAIKDASKTAVKPVTATVGYVGKKLHRVRALRTASKHMRDGLVQQGEFLLAQEAQRKAERIAAQKALEEAQAAADATE